MKNLLIQSCFGVAVNPTLNTLGMFFCVNTRKNDAKIKLTRTILNEPVCVMTARARWRGHSHGCHGAEGEDCVVPGGTTHWGVLAGNSRLKQSIFNFLVKILFVYRAGGRSIFHLAHFGFFSH